ncbi:glycoside hydrolase family 3 N-terminal domain-containing protein [Tetragenococcus koreensis]|uniref:Beta-N-acetylhexosaminidase n=1 Tax=Tetragenococcus koreensis TaxID=290335 RepID=A0AAN4UDP8_9ENTE|nr:glycoside hydrolase family 3 N-terminal domain-containing protein [Tetragenococcus koreensis]GEQ50534.1 beta-N-acetylhexosaminidase [Tetragenococcus koreensis]GEQ53039.1 beta-N-acetylhexosaminidase [Tetragenococcus koreensis]GEQ55542.1 beta-N-acetylhexosaminidase [Tetragenococcus koreensis]GEQ58039.1 beta-N-acetylhexosaminidase [Tetragenococcus koreensis]GEQ60536.1 beta-N-acetylhexosaminidase [Tetragenococcus koreensis]
MKKKGIIISLAAVLAVICAGSIWALTRDEEKQTTAATSTSSTAKTMESSSSEPAENSIDTMIDNMSLEEKVGQLFFVRTPPENQISDIQNYHLGGYVLFGDDTENATKESLQEQIQSFQEASDIPLLIGSDEEGGTVTRISNNSELVDQPFKAPQEIYAENGWQGIIQDTEQKAATLDELGINTGLFPDADVSTDEESFIYDRTIGMDAKGTSKYVENVVKALEEAQSGSTLKHFPGYGNNRDSHVEIVTDDRSLEELRQNDFLPFEAGIKAGADSVLVSHNIVNSIDPDAPASISPAVHEILREELDFDGVVMTDDMDMAGLADFISQEEAGLAALKAGNDLVMSSSYQSQIPYVIQAVEDGDFSEEELDISVQRVLTWKEDLGILHEN